MNIKLGMVLSDISGKSGLAIIRAIVDGEHNPNELVKLADRRCKASKEEMIEALTGMYKLDNIFMMKQELELYEVIHEKIIKIELQIKKNLENLPNIENLEPLPRQRIPNSQKKELYNRSPYSFDLRSLLYRKFGYDLTQLSGIQDSTAAIIIFETGGNLNAFPTAKHFSSWAGVCPGNKVSGGKLLSGRAPKKFSRVGQAFRNAAHSSVRSDNGTGAYLRRLVRNGKSKKTAHKATAHKIALHTYNMIKFGQKYVELGAAEYDKRHEERKIKAMEKTLNKMGYEVSKKVA
jgi:transposase